MGKIANRQWLAFSERNQLSQAIPQFHVERILHQRTPIARFESQCNECRVYKDQILCFRGRYDRQRTLVIRIAAITLASGSAKTIARFPPSKQYTEFPYRRRLGDDCRKPVYRQQICTCKISLSWHFPRKVPFLADFPSLHPSPPPPSKAQILFYCGLAISEFQVPM